jgi:hypothetical protein
MSRKYKSNVKIIDQLQPYCKPYSKAHYTNLLFNIIVKLLRQVYTPKKYNIIVMDKVN